MTNQEKLEAFAPYLPYGLNFYHKRMDGEPTPIYMLVAIQFTGDDLDLQFGDGIDPENVTWESDLVPKIQIDGFESWIKPIFRPLSDLYKPCLECGKVPIVELGNMLGFHNLERYEDNKVVEYGWTSGYYEEDSETFILAWSESLQTLGIWLEECSGEPIQQILNLKALNWLYAHHFWLGDQSEFGKSIIDINTLNQNNVYSIR